MENGITLAGGGALLRGMNVVIQNATGLDVKIADDPLICVARGTGIVLQELSTMQRVLVAVTYSRPPS